MVWLTSSVLPLVTDKSSPSMVLVLAALRTTHKVTTSDFIFPSSDTHQMCTLEALVQAALPTTLTVPADWSSSFSSN